MKLKMIAALIAIAATCALQAEDRPSKQTTNTITQIPFLGDETSVNVLIASPRKYIGQPVIIYGCVTVGNYYNYQ